MHRRERNIRGMVSELGMEIVSFRMDGGSHWRVDVRAPNGRQRPFTFPTRDNGNWHSTKNEIGMLKRWRREVMPELDAAEEAGALPVMDSMKGTLADKLERLNIPLKKSEEFPSHIPPSHVSDVVLAASAVADDNLRHDVLLLPPREARSTPEEALAASVGAPPPTPAPKEPTMSAAHPTTRLNGYTGAIPTTPPTPTTPPPPPERRPRTVVNLNPVQHVRLADWLRTPGRLDDPMTQEQCAVRATMELGFVVTRAHVGNMLSGFGLELKRAPRPDAGSTHRTRVQIIAEAVVKLLEKEGMEVPLDLLSIALGERQIHTPTTNH